MYSVIPVKASPNNWPGKSTCQSNCGNKIPTAGIDTSNALSHQTATSVMSSATSQKDKKFVSPYASVTTGTPSPARRLAPGLYTATLARLVGASGPFDDWLRICQETLALRAEEEAA